MNHDSKDNGNQNDVEEAIWKLQDMLGGPEHANKVVRKHRAKVMAVCIAIAIVTIAAAVIVEILGWSHWLTGILGMIATGSVWVTFFSIRETFISPARRHDPQVQHYRNWLELDIVERERQESQMSEEERAELKKAEMAYYDSGAGRPQTGIGMFSKD